jgi:predicted transcriptional regulator
MISVFEWTEERQRAAMLLADGNTQQEVAAETGVTDRTIRNWLNDERFAAEVDRLSLMIGTANRAERLRIANRVIRAKVKEGIPETEKDLLDWLKFAQSETDGIKLDFGKVAAALAQDEAALASSRPATGDSEGEPTPATDIVS